MRIYKNLLKPGWCRVSVAAALSVCLMQFTSCTKYDLDENDPAEGMPQKARLVEDFPLSAVSKFVVQRDPVTGAYVAFGNLHDPKRPSLGRRVLAMAVSEDFERWRVAHIVADGSAVGNAFTYPEWLIDGEDVLLVSRTAWNGAVNQHDTNMITFHRISNFRQYL